LARSRSPWLERLSGLVRRHRPVKMTLIPNGPVKLTGPIEIVSATGETVERCTEVFLCRCGGSARKPYCDGTHKRIGFRSG